MFIEIYSSYLVQTLPSIYVFQDTTNEFKDFIDKTKFITFHTNKRSN